jgi:hypothetical protein
MNVLATAERNHLPEFHECTRRVQCSETSETRQGSAQIICLNVMYVLTEYSET